MLFVATLLITPAFSFAQSDGSTPPDSKPADATTQTPAALAPADSTGGTQGTAATTTPAMKPVATSAPAGTSTHATPAPQGFLYVPSSSVVVPIEPVPTNFAPDFRSVQGDGADGGSILLWVIIGVAVFGLAFMPFGFLLSGRLKKKEVSEDTENRCFDIKHLMEEKLKELTDVQAMLQELVVEKGKEVMRDSVSGTAAGDVLVRAQKLEEQYKKLKALYEECQIDIDRYQYKGVLVENSLLDKEILKHVKIIRSYEEGDWKLHDIRLSKKHIADIQRSIAHEGWYFHLWEPGKERVTVVFKEKIFEITHSDRSTWRDAIAHGITVGIPEEQLDFRIA